MEAQMNKPGPNGTPGAGAGFANASVNSNHPSSPVFGIILRAVAAALALVATIMMGAAKQDVLLDVYDTDGSLVGTYDVPAKSVYSSSFVYFIAANAAVFLYSSFSMAMSIGRRAIVGSSPLIPIGDVVMVALLFSCNGATGAILVLAEQGNAKAGWGKFCNVYSSFCGKITASLVLSLIVASVYVKLLIFSFINLKKRHQ